MINKNAKAFTSRYDKTLSNVLINEIIVEDPTVTRYKGAKPTLNVKAHAIWDTGATNSAISPTIAKSLNLQPINVVNVGTAGGDYLTNVYVVDILLPNNIWILDVQVTEAPIKGADALIGMDIMLLGDFAVTNSNGETVFSFVVPSIKTIDFVTQIQPKVTPPFNPPVKGKGRKR